MSIRPECLFLLALLFLITGIECASQIIGGLVTAEGKPIPSASITFQKTGTIISSNLVGKFAYTVPSNMKTPFLDTLEFSFIGYETKRIPIYYQGEHLELNVDLAPHAEYLKEAIINARKSYTALQILKKTERNARRNYSNKATLSDGFYREITKENRKATSLSEAKFKVNYARYPQKNFYRKAFRNYYNYAPVNWLKTSDVPSFRHTIIFPEYIPVNKDIVELEETRVSEYLTQTKYTLPTGGPTDLLALDKLKYGTDFFNSKVQKQYDFEKAGIQDHHGTYCYIIRFKPSAESTLRMRSPFSAETSSAIFQGQLLISTIDFSLLYMEYQLSPEVPFEHKKAKMSVDKIAVTYERFTSGRLHLKTVTTHHSKNLYLDEDSTIPATCERTLVLHNTAVQDDVLEEKNRFYTAYGNNIFYNHFTYNSEFWKSYQRTDNYLELAAEVVNELSIETPLEVQFNSINIPIDSIATPEYSQEKYFLEEDMTFLRDSGNELTVEILETENDYYGKVMAKLKSESKAYISEYARAFKYKLDTAKASTYFLTPEGIKFRFKRNERNEQGLYVVQPNLEEKRILNLTLLSEGRPNFNLENYKITSDTAVVYAFSEKGQIWSQMEVSKNEEVIESIQYVSDFDLAHDSVVIYTLSELPNLRASKLFTLNLHSGFRDEILHEKDVTYDLNFQSYFKNGEVFISSECSDGNRLFHVTGLDNVAFCDTLFSVDGMFYEVTDFGNEGIVVSVRQPDENSTLYSYNLKDKKLAEKLYSTSYRIDDFILLKNYLVINQYENLGSKIISIDRNSGKQEVLKFNETEYHADLEKGSSIDEVIVHYDSYQTPYLKLSINLEDSKNKEILEEVEHYRKEKFTAERTEVESGNTGIPLTLYYNKNALKDSIKGVILKVYGAYGAQIYPSFSREDKVYMNSGFIVAFAHVRGTAAKGGFWYKDGKMENKLNTFRDYIACAEYVKDIYKLNRNQLIGYGQSAGGLVMGYVANNRPELFGTLIFDRPYLDVLTTMNDPTLPLTTSEYKEWGNPADSKIYEYMASYSPYQNITKANYPNMLFWSGLEDQQTPYWQVIASVVRYRQNQLGDSKILLKCIPGEGHKGSVSPKNQALKESQVFGFIMNGVTSD